MNSTIILETTHLVLRRQEPGDLDALWGLYSDADVTRYIPGAPRTRAEALEWHRYGHPRDPRLGLWATVLKENGRFIGRCGLLPWRIEEVDEVELAYTIERGQWGKGLATEAARGIACHAFEAIKLSRLICLIDPENGASQRVAEKIAMRLERRVDGIAGDKLPTLIYAMAAPPLAPPAAVQP